MTQTDERDASEASIPRVKDNYFNSRGRGRGQGGGVSAVGLSESGKIPAEIYKISDKNGNFDISMTFFSDFFEKFQYK